MNHDHMNDDLHVISDHHDRFFITPIGPSCLETRIKVVVKDGDLSTIAEAKLYVEDGVESLSVVDANRLSSRLEQFVNRGDKAIKDGIDLRDKILKERGGKTVQ